VTATAAGTQPESSTLTVTSITVALPNGSGSNTSYTLNPGDVALSAPLPALTKSWIAFRVRVEPSSPVNLVGQPHTFTAIAEFSAAPGVWQPVSGGVLDGEWDSSVAQVDPSSSTCPTLSSAGTCTVTVVQQPPLEPGGGTLAVTSLTTPSVTMGGVTTTITDFLDPNLTNATVLDLSAATARKTWVLLDVAITPGVDNLAGESHTFTVEVNGFDGDGQFLDGAGVPGAVVAWHEVSPPVGDVTISGDTCATGTDANGECTITVTNPGSGSVQLQLDQVSVTIGGQPFVINLTSGAPGLRSDEDLPIQTDKVWWQYRVVLSDSAVNPLGVNHTFTATVQRTNDNGATWQPVPAGTLLQDQWTDPLNVSSVITANSTCLTTGTLADGTCTFVVTSTAATAGTLTIQGIASTWLDRNRNGQSGAPTDPIPDPVELDQEIVSIPSSAFGAGSVLTGRKTWLDFAVDVSGAAENPVGTDHTFTLLVRFSDGTGFQPVAGGTTMTYSWTGPAGSAEDKSRSTCDPANGPGTDASGQCTVVIGSPTVPGIGTLTISGIASTSIAQPPPQPPSSVSFTFTTPGTTTKTWVAYRALMSPDSTNLAGTSHDFTVTVQQDRGDGNGFVAAPDGTTIAVGLSDASKLVGQGCSTTGTTAGTCTVTVASAVPGAVTVTPGAITASLLSGADPPGTRVPVTVTPGSAAYAPPTAATKTWIAYAVTVSPPAINPVGTQHDFTISASVTDGTTTTPTSGGSIAFTWTGAGSLLTPSPCTTNAAGACTVSVTSTSAGTGTVMVTSLTDSSGRLVDLTAAGLPGQAPGQRVPLAATKTWLQYRVVLSPPTATNLTGVPHTFTATVQVTGLANPTEADWAPVSDGTTLTATPSGAGSLDPVSSSCMTGGTVGGTCTFVVDNPTPGTLTLNVATIATTTINAVPFTDIPLSAAAKGSKVWVAYTVTVSPSAINAVGAPHDFTITATVTDGTTTSLAVGASVAFTWTGAGSLSTPSPCTTSAAGTCTVTVTSAAAGSGTLTVRNLTDSDGRLVDLTTAGSPGQAAGQRVPLTASKTWSQYRVVLTPSATNLVGVAHTFTATVQHAVVNDPTEADWMTVPDGTTLTVATSGSGLLDPASSCLNAGTIAGACQLVARDRGAGTFNLAVTAIASTTIGGVPATNIGLAAPATASKTWVAYAVTISPPATNPVGAPHDFTISAAVSDGTTTTPAANASVAFTWTGAGTLLTSSPCSTSAAGRCTVRVTSMTAGAGTLTVMSLTDSAGRVVDLTAAGAPGQAPTQTVPLTSTKTWLRFRVLVSADSTNLVGVQHTFLATVQSTGAPNPTEVDWATVPDATTLQMSSTGRGMVDQGATACVSVGTRAGVCAIVVKDAGPGTLSLSVSAIAATMLNGVRFVDIPLTAQAAAKETWIAYGVTVPSSATNPVGMQHDFTITATKTDGASTTPAASASIAFVWSGAGSLVTPSACTTTNDGTCAVRVTSNAPGTGTLTVSSLEDIGGNVVDLTTAGAPGQAAGQVVPLTTSKTWLQYRVLLSPSATNVVGTPHTFTATVQSTSNADPIDADWVVVPDGTTLTEKGVATPAGSAALNTSSSCLTAGTKDGVCEFVVTNNGIPGTLDLTVTAIASTTLDGMEFTDIALTGAATARKTWVITNLVVHKSDGGATPVAGADPFNYTITVTNQGPVATSAPVTVTDTMGPGLTFAGAPTMPPAMGSCAPPAGRTLTCTIAASIAVDGTETITVPARVAATAVGPVENTVTIDSREDPLCPNGACPPPPECAASTTFATRNIAVLAKSAAGNSSDDEACVVTSVTGSGSVVPPPTSTPVSAAPSTGGELPFTGYGGLAAVVGCLFVMSGFGLVVVTRRRRRRRRGGLR
jgi:hypothetical protein